MSILNAIGRNFLDFLPLFLFLQMAALSKESGAAKWLLAYEVAALVAVFHAFFLISRKRVASRIALGIDAYLMLGGVACLAGFVPIMDMLNRAREFGVLLVLCIVGIATTLFSSSGFVGFQDGARDVRRYSVYLLILTFAAALMSFLYRGNPMLAGVIPVLAVVVANKLFLSSSV